MVFNRIRGLESLSVREHLALAYVFRGGGDHHETIVSLEVALLKEDPEPERTHFLLGTEYHQLGTSGEDYLPEEVVKEIQRYRKKLGKQHPFNGLEGYFAGESMRLIDSLIAEGGGLLPYGLATIVLTSYDDLPNLAKASMHIDKFRGMVNPMPQSAEEVSHQVFLDFADKYPALFRRLFSYLGAKKASGPSLS